MLFTLFFGISVAAQNIVNITYYEIPRENSAEFLRSHQKFTDLSMSENRLILGAGVFAHVHADNYTYVSYEFYNSVADIEKDGVPTEDKVAEIFDAIIPLLPTPQIITFDLHLAIAFTASLNESSSELLSFFNALICKSITLLPISLISFFIS